MTDQTFWDQLQRWHLEDEHQKIVDAIEALPENQRTPELVSLQARAYNNLAAGEEGDRPLLEKALSLLLPLADDLGWEHNWNFRVGYAYFYLDREKEALPYFEQALAAMPGDEDTQEFIDQCKKYIAMKEFTPVMYDEADWDAVEAHIQKYFGECPNVYHEVVSPDIHVDICVIPPSEERDFYTLVTMGMGAHKMNVPSELAEKKLNRAELIICLPPDWELDQESLEDEAWYWPIRLLKATARLPINENSWLGWGHTVASGPDGEPYHDSVDFSSIILTQPGDFPEDAAVCTLPDGDEVNFYALIPLYQEELDFKLTHGAGALIDLMCADPEAGPLMLLDPERRNICAPETLEEDWAQEVLAELEEQEAEEDESDSSPFLMDAAEWHLESIREKGLQVEEITAYNHMAIYLRWCMEHDLMGDIFLEKYGDVAAAVKAGYGPDLRVLLRDQEDLNFMDGALILPYFSDEGAAFAQWYYGDEQDEAHYYPCDIDDHAMFYFGQERYESDEFQHEAYLFVPFNEEYYREMAMVIDHRFAQWQASRDDT